MSGDGFEDVLFRCFLDLPAQKELVQYEIGLLEIENYVQLTYLQRQQETIRVIPLRLNKTHKKILKGQINAHEDQP